MEEKNIIALRLVKVFFENGVIKERNNSILEIALLNISPSHVGVIRSHIGTENYGFVLSYVDELLFNNTQSESLERYIGDNIKHNNSDEKQAISIDGYDSNNNHTDSEYGQSFEIYGGYNDYSDDVIDDAFEGDPSATWNVD